MTQLNPVRDFTALLHKVNRGLGPKLVLKKHYDRNAWEGDVLAELLQVVSPLQVGTILSLAVQAAEWGDLLAHLTISRHLQQIEDFIAALHPAEYSRVLKGWHYRHAGLHRVPGGIGLMFHVSLPARVIRQHLTAEAAEGRQLLVGDD